MSRIIDLQRGELLALEVASGDRVQVLFGTVWLTEPRRLDDVFARSGDEIAFEYGGRVLLEAQGFARVIVPAIAPAAGFNGAIPRLLAAVHRMLPVRAFATT